MCRNTDDGILATGDVQGHVVLWNIRGFCTGDEDVELDARPRQIASWKAHAQVGAQAFVRFTCHFLGASFRLLH